MTSSRVFPYYYPTTAIFVDDDRDFLLNFSLQLDQMLSYHLYDSPKRAMNYINNKAIKHDRRSFFSIREGEEMHPASNQVITLSVADIHKEIYNENRFSEVSVLVVDYAMPGVDGIEFCKSFKDSPIKKVLLTGKADEHVAVQAFNDGIIDRFVRKNDPKVVEIINQNITELQQVYFKDNAEIMMQTLVQKCCSFINDIGFAEYFTDLCRQYNIVEYYMLSNPKGFLLVDGNGKSYLLMAMPQEDLNVHLEIATDEGAPQDLLNCLQSGEKIPYFAETDGFYQDGMSNWKACLYPAKKIESNDSVVYCAMLETHAFSGITKNQLTTYNKYLEELDFILQEEMPF